MELRYRNLDTKAIGVAFVTDNDAEVMRAMWYYHDDELDYTDDEKDGEWVEIWTPINKEI
jgi:hypothetical protein